MVELYLIAHKVRGEPAFDVAQRVPCVHCQAYESVTGLWCEAEHDQATCIECDQLGYQWIIPTSGHRAYPARHWLLTDLYDSDCSVVDEFEEYSQEAFNRLPDHYQTRAAPKVDLATALGITKPKAAPLPPIVRRF